MKTTVRNLLIAATFFLGSLQGHAAIDLVNDDTDLFMVNPNISSSRPNVLLMIDNSANWSASSGGATKRQNEMDALTTTLNDLTDQFNVGVMLFMEATGNPSTAENSAGYVRFGIRQMSGSIADNTTHKGRLASLFSAIRGSGNNDQSSSSFAYSMGMFETYLYFKGASSTTGTQAVARHYVGNADSRAQPYIDGLPTTADGIPLPLSGSGSTTYQSPIVSDCQKNYLIIISNGQDGSAASQNKGFNALNGIQSGTTEISPTTAVYFPDVNGAEVSAVPASGVWTDEWARYMANNDCGPGTSTTQRPIYTYVIDVDPQTNTTARRFSALLYNTAKEGKGQYFAVSNDGTALAAALKAVFQQIQAVNSVFASTTLPVSNNVRGTNLNQTYIGVFRPDPDRKPRWPGNMKLYKIGSNLDELVDANAPSQPVYNTVTGFAFNTAKSFWTTSSTFWAFRSPYAVSDVGGASDSPDGDLVEKGGAAQRIRTVHATNPQSSRLIYTCTGTCATSFTTPGTLLSATPFNNTNVSAADLKAFTKIALSSITSSGTMATAVTSAAHGFGSTGSTVSGIEIEGASPSVFNGTYTITITGASSFTYTLSSAPATNSARVTTSTAHALTVSDRVTVTGASPAGYNVTTAAISSTLANSFNYPMAASESSAASGYSVTAIRRLSDYGGSLSAPSGTATTATLVLPAHGLTLATSPVISVQGASESAFNVTNTVATVLDTNRLSYTTSGTLTSAAGSTTVVATVPSHGLGSAGSTVGGVVIAGASPADYNGTYSVQIIDANSFSYTVPVAVAVNASGTITANATLNLSGSAQVSNGNGSSRSAASVSTATAHGLGSTGSTATVTISGAGSSTPNSFFNGTFTTSITGASSFGYTMSCAATGGSATCPTGNTTVTGISYSATVSVARSVSSIVPSASGATVVATGSVELLTAVSNITSVSVESAANTASATVGNPASGNNTERDAIIEWVRGLDNIDDENNSNTTPDQDVRAFVHGDVLHSRPAVVNYNRNTPSDDNDIYVFYGTNDGLFRAAKGGFASDGGNEAWAFVAPEFFGKLKRLRDNSPVISGAQPRDYFFDGPTAVYTLDANNDGKYVAADGDKVYLYLSMRRGGRMIYALDVTTPTAPRMLWKKGCPNMTNNTDCSTGWDEIGQTWSEPRVAKIRANANPVLIFGAGYDPSAEDFQPCLVTASTSASVTAYRGGATTYLANGGCWMSGGTSVTENRTKGRGLFIVDAVTGGIVWRVGPDATRADRQVATMTYAIPGDVAIVNRNRDAYVDRLYATDTAGNVWRFDIDENEPSKWVVNMLASLGGSARVPRKMLYSVRVTSETSTCGDFDMILVGTGDREHPFFAGYFSNPATNPGATTPTYLQERFYMIKDSVVGLVNPEGVNTLSTDFKTDLYRTPIADSDLYDASSNCIQDCSLQTERDAAKAALQAAQGWYVTLANGEKTVTGSAVAGGYVEFATNQPKGNAGSLDCSSDLGLARKYRMKVCDATVDTTGITLATGETWADHRVTSKTTGLPPTPTQATVCQGGNCQTVTCFGPECHQPVTLKLDTRRRTFWYKKTQP